MNEDCKMIERISKFLIQFNITKNVIDNCKFELCIDFKECKCRFDVEYIEFDV